MRYGKYAFVTSLKCVKLTFKTLYSVEMCFASYDSQFPQVRHFNKNYHISVK